MEIELKPHQTELLKHLAGRIQEIQAEANRVNATVSGFIDDIAEANGHGRGIMWQANNDFTELTGAEHED